jgi:hypothetical protein
MWLHTDCAAHTAAAAAAAAAVLLWLYHVAWLWTLAEFLLLSV